MPIDWNRHYAGPIRRQDHAALKATICLGCGEALSAEEMSQGAHWHWRCKDPEGYGERLRAAMAENRRLLLEAYPVCKHCGKTLPQAFVDEGRDSHVFKKGDCDMPAASLPLATRRD